MALRYAAGRVGTVAAATAAAAATSNGQHASSDAGVRAPPTVVDGPQRHAPQDEGWVMSDLQGENVIFGDIPESELNQALNSALQLMPRRGGAKTAVLIEALDSDSDTSSEGGALADAAEIMREADEVLGASCTAQEMDGWLSMIRAAVNDPNVQQAFLQNAQVRDVLRQLNPPGLESGERVGGPFSLAVPAPHAPHHAGPGGRRPPAAAADGADPFAAVGKAIEEVLGRTGRFAVKLFKNLRRALAEAWFNIEGELSGKKHSGAMVVYSDGTSDGGAAHRERVDWLLASATAMAMAVLAVLLFRGAGMRVRFPRRGAPSM